MKNQHTFLNHLKIGSLFYFVEIDVKQLVSNHTLKLFHNILKERAKTSIGSVINSQNINTN